MFELVKPLPADPLLGILAACAQDPNPNKVDLGVGVYKDESGKTPIFAAVKAAEATYIAAQSTKAYIGPAGSAAFNRLHPALVFGAAHPALTSHRLASVQTPGGCGALRVAAEMIKRSRADTTVWVSTPTWANHEPLLGDSGLRLARYPYYDHARRDIDFDAMFACLQQVPATDAILLHACCHNPSGADLSREQWQAVATLAQQNGFTVFIDSAYQGFGEGLEEDAYGIRLLADSLPELIVASSCSKNFGLYRERVGSLCIMTNTAEQATAVTTHLNKIVRGIYSMPPAHGAAIVETLLADEILTRQWRDELAAVRERILRLRADLADALHNELGEDRYRFLARQRGMFSFLGLTPEQVQRMREVFGIYMAGDSRINVAGLNTASIDCVAGAVGKILKT